MKTKYSLGVFFCMVATLSWGGMFPIMTSALKYIDPFNFTAMRYSIAGVAFLFILLFREGPQALNLKGERMGLAWFLGTAGFVGFGFLVFLGRQLAGPTGALMASIVMATMTMLGLLVGGEGSKAADVDDGLYLAIVHRRYSGYYQWSCQRAAVQTAKLRCIRPFVARSFVLGRLYDRR